jgi:hypothetical protein
VKPLYSLILGYNLGVLTLALLYRFLLPTIVCPK